MQKRAASIGGTVDAETGVVDLHGPTKRRKVGDDDSDSLEDIWDNTVVEEEEPAPVAKKRTVGRRAAPRKAPARRKVGRAKKDD